MNSQLASGPIALQQLKKAKWPLLAVVSILLMVGLVTQILAAMVDVDKAISPLETYVLELSGQPLIHGDVSVSILGGPRIDIEGVAVRYNKETQAPFFFHAEHIEIHVGLLDVISEDQPPISRIVIVEPLIDMERDKRGRPSWDFLLNQTAHRIQLPSTEIVLKKGAIRYQNLNSEHSFAIDEMNGSLSLAQSNIGVKLQATLLEKTLNLSGACVLASMEGMNDFDADCHIDASGEQLSINADNRLIMKQGALRSRGSLALETEDVSGWGDAFFSQTNRALEGYFTKELPVKAQIEIYADDTSQILNLSSFEAGNTSGKAGLKYVTNAPSAQLTMTAAFEHLDYDELLALMEKSSGTQQDIFAFEGGFNPMVSGSVQLGAQTVNYNGLSLEKLRVVGQIGAGEISITDANALLPGEGSMITLGRLSSSAAGLQYEGLFEASGKSFAALAPPESMFTGEVFDKHFTTYRMRFNAIISPDATILSELRLITGEKRIRIAGGINVHEDEEKGLTGVLSLENIDFTDFENAWIGEASLLENPVNLSEDNPLKFTWLKKFKQVMAIKVELKSYRFLGRDGDQSSIVIVSEPHQIGFEQANLRLTGTRIQGRATIRLDDQLPRPYINSQLNISRLELGNLIRSDLWADPANSAGAGADDSIWSKRPINFYPLHHFDGYHELRARRIMHERFSASSFRGVIDVSNFQLTLKKAKMTLWKGNFSPTLTIDARVLPSMRMDYRLESASIDEFLQSFVDYSNVKGRLTLGGSLSTNGVNFSNWMTNMKGTVSMDARGVFVQYFNLPAIIRSITSVRAVSGISNAVRLAFDKGASRFASVEGVMFFDSGKLNTTRMNVRSNETVGQMEGHFDLLQWENQLLFKLGLTALSQTNYPYLIINITGPIEQPNRRLDLKSVEAFMAKKLR